MPGVCSKCGKKQKKSFAGSLTQWINACDCFRVDRDAVEYNQNSKLCLRCNKLVEPARSGSMTQWVFASNRCRCNQPVISELDDASLTRSREPGERKSSERGREADPKSEESELENVSDAFPRHRYKPLCELGKGANGVVYLCRDRLLGKKVAVKMLHSATNESIIDFQKEAKIASSLNHPSIVKVLDFGADGGVPFLVMEFVAGPNLKDFINRRGPLSMVNFSRIGIQLANAIQYAHDRQVIHRDLKPENIIVPESEALPVVILDFGLARAMELGSNTRQGTVIGTPMFMSPEQAEGLEADWRSDIYSLGCVYYFMLTGRAPLSEKEFRRLMVNSDAGESLPIAPPGDDKLLNNMILRMLERRRNFRIGSTRGLVTLLERYLPSVEEASRHPSPEAHTPRPSPPNLLTETVILKGKRQSRVAFVGATVTLSIMGGLLCLLILNREARRDASLPILKVSSPVQLYAKGEKVRVYHSGRVQMAEVIDYRNGMYFLQFDAKLHSIGLWVRPDSIQKSAVPSNDLKE